MKKKILGLMFFAVLSATAIWSTKQKHQETLLEDLIYSNTEALAINDMCPNGCTDDGGGCYCNGWHREFAEYGGW